MEDMSDDEDDDIFDEHNEEASHGDEDGEQCKSAAAPVEVE